MSNACGRSTTRQWATDAERRGSRISRKAHWETETVRQRSDRHNRRRSVKDLAIALDNRPGALAEMGEALGKAGVPAEGRFFPDTYRFAAGTTVSLVVDTREATLWSS